MSNFMVEWGEEGPLHQAESEATVLGKVCTWLSVANALMLVVDARVPSHVGWQLDCWRDDHAPI